MCKYNGRIYLMRKNILHLLLRYFTNLYRNFSLSRAKVHTWHYCIRWFACTENSCNLNWNNFNFSFACFECGKRFVRRNDQRVHELLHTSYEQFDCKKCGQRFRRQIYLRKHESSCRVINDNANMNKWSPQEWTTTHSVYEENLSLCKNISVFSIQCCSCLVLRVVTYNYL